MPVSCSNHTLHVLGGYLDPPSTTCCALHGWIFAPGSVGSGQAMETPNLQLCRSPSNKHAKRLVQQDNPDAAPCTEFTQTLCW